MTFDERVHAVEQKGFTERQARFLTTVMLHAGVCIPRQYARFCGIVYGAKTRKFFDKLVRLRYASMYDCRHNRARIYHVNQRALYAAIGETESRLRKPVTLNHAIQRLMVLDAIVEDPDLVWLGTAEEKSTHLTTLLRIEPADLPHISTGGGDARTVRYFPDRLPIGIHPAGRGVVVYVLTDPWLDEFRVFLLRHAALLRALPAWTLRIVVPPHFPGHRSAGQTGCLESADDAAQDRHPRRAAVVFRAGSSSARAIPLSRPGRTVLPSSRRLLRTTVQGAVPCVEGGWRHRFCRLPITRAR